MTVGKAGKLALLWRGNRHARDEATAQNNRLNRVFEALTALGIHAEPAIYADDVAGDVREQLLKLDGVLVWVDPISDGQNRTQLDAMLRDVASRGVWVSTHPDVVLKMGVKEVLYRTKHLGWGTDTHLYRTARAFNEQFSPAASIGRSAGPQTKPRQWRSGRMEGRARFSGSAQGGHRPRVACAPRQRTRRDAARRFHEKLRSVFCQRRVHCRSTIPAAAERRHDPLLHGRGEGRRFRSPAHQSVDPAAAGRPGLASRTTRPTHYVPCVCTGV